jgi:hypothetical protein
MQGNRDLAEGRWAEARAAFQRAQALDPKRPHIAERLAEIDRLQQAISVPLARPKPAAPNDARPNPPLT